MASRNSAANCTSCRCNCDVSPCFKDNNNRMGDKTRPLGRTVAVTRTAPTAVVKYKDDKAMSLGQDDGKMSDGDEGEFFFSVNGPPSEPLGNKAGNSKFAASSPEENQSHVADGGNLIAANDQEVEKETIGANGQVEAASDNEGFEILDEAQINEANPTEDDVKPDANPDANPEEDVSLIAYLLNRFAPFAGEPSSPEDDSSSSEDENANTDEDVEVEVSLHEEHNPEALQPLIPEDCRAEEEEIDSHIVNMSRTRALRQPAVDGFGMPPFVQAADAPAGSDAVPDGGAAAPPQIEDDNEEAVAGGSVTAEPAICPPSSHHSSAENRAPDVEQQQQPEPEMYEYGVDDRSDGSDIFSVTPEYTFRDWWRASSENIFNSLICVCLFLGVFTLFFAWFYAAVLVPQHNGTNFNTTDIANLGGFNATDVSDSNGFEVTSAPVIEADDWEEDYNIEEEKSLRLIEERFLNMFNRR